MSEYTNRIRPPSGEIPALALHARKVNARRYAVELPVNGVIDLGIGMPEGVAPVAAEEGLLDHVPLTAEPGVISGQPASGLDFGAAGDVDAVIPQNAQFDFYDDGGLDMACLGSRTRIRRVTRTSRASAPSSPARAESATSVKTRGRWSSPARYRPGASVSLSRTRIGSKGRSPVTWGPPSCG